MTTKLVNLTPHPLSFHKDGVVTVVAPDGRCPRVLTVPGAKCEDSDLPCDEHERDTVVGLVDMPEPEDGTVFVVSGLVGEALRNAGATRTDVRVPGTGPADGTVRNDKGHVVGVTRLKRV